MSDIVPWGPLGYITYKRTYARPKKNGQSEEFHETVDRILSACNTQLKCGFSNAETLEFRNYLMKLKGSVAGRFLWQLGTSTVSKLGLFSLQNCAFTTINDPIEPFTWAMDALMLGSGVGYSIEKEHVYGLPRVRRAKIVRRDANDSDFIVPDSREGWVELLRRVLQCHFEGGGFTFSTHCIRSKGAPIKGFGGVASGPEELCWGIDKISGILNSRAGKKLRPIDCLDIMNIIGAVVVAGNVRRSAQIAIGDFDDMQYLAAKRWDLGNVPSWRSMSNNSVVCNDFSLLPDSFWEGYRGNGEPYGLINLNLSRKIGRLGETQYPDPDVMGFNPCAEQPLGDKETCCLAEVYLPNIDSLEELKSVATYLYRVNKHSLTLKCHHADTQEIVNNNMRMGIGVTGYLQATDQQKSWLKPTYEYLREYDKDYSEVRGWPTSIKLTTVKPSGTLSLLPGVTPGIHPAYSSYFIRRMRMAADSHLVQVCRDHGYHVEPDVVSSGTAVVEFPIAVPKGTTVAKDMSAVDQLEVVKTLQRDWSDNAVSCTVYYKLDELPAIRDWLSANYNDSVKSVSFLLHNEHGFAQAPYEEISSERYQELVAKTKQITGLAQIDENDVEIDECVTGACPVK